MKSVDLTAFGKPHTVTVPDDPPKRELKSWSERHHYETDEEWDGEHDLWDALPWILAWCALMLIGLLWAWVRYG